MPRQRRPNRPEEPLDGPLDGPEGEEGALAGSLFANMAADAYVMVYRQHPTKKTPVFLYRLAPEESSEERIAELSGGGIYDCRVKRKNPAGQYVWGPQRRVEIAGPEREPPVTIQRPASQAPTPPAPTSRVEEAADGSVGPTHALTAGIIDLFKASRETTALLVESMRAQASRPSVDWAVVIPALVPLFVKMIERPTPVAPTESPADSTINLVTKVAELLKANTGPAASMKDQLETMDAYLGLRERVADIKAAAGDDPASVEDIVKDNLGKFLDIIQQEQSRRGQRPASPQKERKAVAAGEQRAVEMPGWQRALMPFRKQMFSLARAGKDPERTAEFLTMVASDAQKGIVREFLAQGDVALEQFFIFMPEMKQYEQWTSEFFGVVADELGLFQEDDNNDETVTSEDTDEPGGTAPGSEGSKAD